MTQINEIDFQISVLFLGCNCQIAKLAVSHIGGHSSPQTVDVNFQDTSGSRNISMWSIAKFAVLHFRGNCSPQFDESDFQVSEPILGGQMPYSRFLHLRGHCSPQFEEIYLQVSEPFLGCNCQICSLSVS